MLGIGSDHWGVELKGGLYDFLTDRGLQVLDFGTAFTVAAVACVVAWLLALDGRERKLGKEK